MGGSVRLRNVSMKFILHHQKARSFQDAVINLILRRNEASEEFWALRDVSLDVQAGETLGIIGTNGSGKSTLLKLITRILEPTRGTVVVEGKVSALIELGAGFHPDLTGRENIYLNGSILGLGRREMDRRFDEIVSFSELERFIDTPVKHYSSGMYARLGFSVAISVDPDVLIIDEVLSVGDEAFQRKCLDRISSLRRKGTTIIFVTHDLATVERLCDRVIWLREGIVEAVGSATTTIGHYLEALHQQDNRPRETAPASSPDVIAPGSSREDPGLTEARIGELQLLDEEYRPKSSFRTGDRLILRTSYTVPPDAAPPTIQVTLRRSDGLLLLTTTHACSRPPATGSSSSVEVEFDALPLLDGSYEFSVALQKGALPSPVPTTARAECRFAVWSDRARRGLVALSHQWREQAAERFRPAELSVQPGRGVR